MKQPIKGSVLKAILLPNLKQIISINTIFLIQNINMSTIGLKKSPSNPSLLVPVIKSPFLILFYVQLERYL
ncbi:hypothetical protein NC653_041956 [Populus alba x Populus x berolinensis]|uniref:Uncharacterized protein n=1 Tax=Populus alba x Populus x berolinensis TaxID=444605 RepID=A0AAD6LAQ0_9ROSI|nr:hypothetical protein NC653_041832 [Populus alba x Populus x berolinensis]KAJ6952978.1 hypothetical protein NC653_041956 [Populus alba x Populus x berolinensis]